MAERESTSILDEAFCEQNSTAGPGEYVELVVRDTGAGIPGEQVERIFEPFYTTKDQGKGTGLGLAMVYGFVTRSRGCIKCDSELGVGTVFHLYLPRAEKIDVVDDQSNDDEAVDNIPQGKETILVVDDEAGLVKLAKHILEIQGYHVLTATDGVMALKILDEEPGIDLLFSDIVMPNGINGYELAEQATSNRPELKVLLTSGYTEKVELQSNQQIFAANLLSKPYTQVELAKAVRVVLDRQGIVLSRL